MTEAEWLACTDHDPMLEFLRGKAADRKLRLFAESCCRRAWHLLAEEWSRPAVEVAGLHANGLAGVTELTAAKGWASSAREDLRGGQPAQGHLRAGLVYGAFWTT